MIHRIDATVLFVQDLAACTTFYRDTLAFRVLESDAVSVSFRVGDQYFLILEIAAAAELLTVAAEALKSDGRPRGLLAAGVANVDATYADYTAKGVTFLRAPTDQTWGLRTAHFADPEGNIWEINQPVAAKPVG